jgi:hypothetical protein
MKLTITDKVFVPVSEKTDYVICHDESDLGKEDIIWNVKEEADKYLLSKEQLEKVISDAIQFGISKQSSFEVGGGKNVKLIDLTNEFSNSIL